MLLSKYDDILDALAIDLNSLAKVGQNNLQFIVTAHMELLE